MEKEKEKKKYPIGAEHYTLYEEVGTGGSATVHRALCIPFNEIVAVKILDCERGNCDLNNVSRESQTMVLVDHPNVLKSHCSFVSDHNLWFVMPYMAGGSCLHILKAAHPNGFEEVVIATILREALKGLDYLHQHGHIHRDVKAGNVLIDSRGGIKLADFGVSAYMFNGGDRQRRNTFTGTPCWMAPEVMEQVHGYDCKADIWSFGITALELARGHAPFSKYPPMKVLLLTLQNAPPGLDHERDKKFSKSFRHMIGSCLVKDPTKRPSAKELLRYSFFKQARSNDYIARTLLAGLPALGDRLQALKKQDEDMLAQEKMPDGEKEEISQNEYKRGISGWNFDLEDLKAQASLIPDDDAIAEKQLQHQSSFSKNHSLLQHQSSFASKHSDANYPDDSVHTSISSADSTINIAKGEKSNGNVNVSGSTMKQSTSNTALGSKNPEDKLLSDVKKQSSDGAPSSSNQSTIDKGQNQAQNLSSSGITNLQISDNTQLEITTKGSKTSVNGDEVDEKAKVPVVRQKGRFKVTSENVEIEKVAPAPVLLKSHSMQVIPQHPAISSFLPYSATPSSPLARTLASLQSVLQINIQEKDYILGLVKQIAAGDSTGYTSMNGAITETSLGISQHPALSSSVPHNGTPSNPQTRALASLQSALQANIQERDYILGQMKQVAVADSIDIGCTSMNAAATQKSLLEAAHDNEKHLLSEVVDLQWRLINAQEELRKYKAQMKS